MENKLQMMTIKETNKIMQFLQGLVVGILVTAVLIHLVACSWKNSRCFLI
ncbi:TPA: hypothetical protein VB839_000433 [Streptococcus suis]|nr:hypothetical protein [Streptococcus suis]